MGLSVLKKNKSRSAEQLAPTTEQIPRDWSTACMDLCAQETSPSVNALLKELRLSVWNEQEVMNKLTSSTSE